MILQESVTCELGSVYKYRKCGSKRQLTEVKDTFQYVPLIDNLQHLLENKDVFDEVCHVYILVHVKHYLLIYLFAASINR